MAFVEPRPITAHTDGELFNAELGDYFALLKPRVMSLVVFTAFVGMVLAPYGLHPILAAVALLAIAVGAGAAGALNMWFDADIDAVMSRTRSRPIPAGRVERGEAAFIGVFLSVASVAVLYLVAGSLAAALLAFTIFFYAVVYTMWLKRWTAQNIVIGGASGALPPVIGWAAMTGEVSLLPVVLFLIIFLWTPPHSWALALIRSGDYDRAGVPMMPVKAGHKSTRLQMLLYSLLLAPLPVVPALIGSASLYYGIFAAILGAVFVERAWRVFRVDSEDYRERAAARSLFAYSILYLALVFGGLLADALLLRLGVIG
jgi:protoheme IX farnesyltransferase